MDTNLIYVLGGIIVILIIVIIYLISELKEKDIEYDTLQDDYNGWKDKFEFAQREVKRCHEQIKIYEKREEEVSSLKIFYNKKVKVNPIYKGKRALIGDYMDDSSEITAGVLRSYGLIVDVVRSGEDIIDKIKHGYKCDIIFTNNVYKKGPDGPNTLDELKEIEGFDIPVVIHTVSDNKRNHFINGCGFDEYVVKPLDQEKIKPILDKFLGSR